MIQIMQNPSPNIHMALQLSNEEQRQRRALEQDESVADPIDALEIFQLIRHLNDPEYPLTLQQLNVVNVDRCHVDQYQIRVQYTPTIPHCSMAQVIGLMITAKLLQYLPQKYKVSVKITAGAHVKEHQINKQINDKERVAAALENNNIKKVLQRGFMDSDKYELNL